MADSMIKAHKSEVNTDLFLFQIDEPDISFPAMSRAVKGCNSFDKWRQNDTVDRFTRRIGHFGYRMSFEPVAALTA